MAENNSGDNLAAFLLGGLVGAALGVLLAPRKGKDSRRMLADWFEENKDKAEELLKSGKEAFQSEE